MIPSDFFKGKVVIVTGATSGIGREAAVLFSQSGMNVAAGGRDLIAGQSLIQETANFSGEILFIPTEIDKDESVRKFVEEACSHFGRIDFALNCAGTEGKFVPFTDQDETDWDYVIGVNLKGVWTSMKYQIQAMLKHGFGGIVNISSVIADRALPNTSIYTASKSGVNALTRVAAVEYGKANIRINAISPGAVETPMLERIASKEAKQQLKDENPLKKMQPQKILQRQPCGYFLLWPTTLMVKISRWMADMAC